MNWQPFRNDKYWFVKPSKLVTPFIPSVHGWMKEVIICI